MGNKALVVHVDIKSMSAVQLNQGSQYETEPMIDAQIQILTYNSISGLVHTVNIFDRDKIKLLCLITNDPIVTQRIYLRGWATSGERILAIVGDITGRRCCELLRNFTSTADCKDELTDVVGTQMGELKIFINSPSKQPWGLTHGGCINPVFSLIAGHELVQSKSRNSRIER